MTCPHHYSMSGFTMDMNVSTTLTDVYGPRQGCLYTWYACGDAINRDNNYCWTPFVDRSCWEVTEYDMSTSLLNVGVYNGHECIDNVDGCLRTSSGVFVYLVCMWGCYNWGHQQLSDPVWGHIMSTSVPIWRVHIELECVVCWWTLNHRKRSKMSPDLGRVVDILCIHVGKL